MISRHPYRDFFLFWLAVVIPACVLLYTLARVIVAR